MADFPDINSLTLEQLRQLTQSEAFKDAPRLYRGQVFTRLEDLARSQRARENLPILDQETALRLAAPAQERARQRSVREEQQARQLREATQPPAQPASVPAAPSPEDLTSQAMRALLPRPAPAAEATPEPTSTPPETPPTPPIPTPAPSAPEPSRPSGGRSIALGESAEARRARAASEMAETMKGLQEPERKPSIMDSPYTAIINAGLNILMGGAGKSPLEAIATGGGAALKTLGEQAAREEARGEKRLDRAYKRAELGTKIRSEIQGLEQKEEQLRLELEKIVAQRANYASEAAHRTAILGIQQQIRDTADRRADLEEMRVRTQQAGLAVQGLQAQIRSADDRLSKLQLQLLEPGLTPTKEARLKNMIRAAQAEVDDLKAAMAAQVGRPAPTTTPRPQPELPSQRRD